jgi:hypothetical protein
MDIADISSNSATGKVSLLNCLIFRQNFHVAPCPGFERSSRVSDLNPRAGLL